MSGLTTTREFEDELDQLVETHPDDVGLIDALIEQLGHDEDYLADLVNEVPKWHFQYKPSFEFKRFVGAWRTRRQIFSLKPYDEFGHLIPFRVFVAYDRVSNEYFFLSVQPRSTCYDTTTDAFRSLCDRYDRLGILPSP